MARVPKVIQDLVEAFERLPGIGPKTAQRLTYYLLHAPKEETQALADAAINLKENAVVCQNCFNISDKSPCEICTDDSRDRSMIAVVEDPLDVLALERAHFKGLYHVLHGAIKPMENIGPSELHMRELLPRLNEPVPGVKVPVVEVILATNPTMEGDATAMYLQRLLSTLEVKVSRIARGLPVGGDLEYADETTLSRSIEGRREY